jgi:hypothetical protein
VARQSPQRRNADEPETALDEASTPDAADPPGDTDEAAEAAGDDEADAGDEPDEADVDEDAEAEEPSGDRSLWIDTRVDPVEIALPAGVGYTLRAYRISTELTPTEVGERDEDDPFDRGTGAEVDDEEVVILDEEFAALLEEDEESTDRRRRGRDAETDEGDEPDFSDDEDDEDEDDEAGEEDEADEPVAEEVPVFLSHRGKLLLFKSPESLVAFVRSGAPHDLAQVDTWTAVAEGVEPADIAAADDDTYELDLVVENLRGGHDTWDVDLLIQAGEIARDLAYALRLTPVMTALSAGSPIDDLDEALRAAAGGGFGGFRGRRRLRRIGAQQASLGWRSIIGKISAAVDWRD